MAVVDSCYPNRVGYLAPFKGSTYYILEFRHHPGHPLQRRYEMFNFLHSSLRNVIEQSFGVLKQKWRILKGIPSFSTRIQKHIILACIAVRSRWRTRGGEQFFVKTKMLPANRNKSGLKLIGLAKTIPLYLLLAPYKKILIEQLRYRTR